MRDFHSVPISYVSLLLGCTSRCLDDRCPGLQSARGAAVTDYTRSTRRHVLRMGAVATAGLLVPHRDALALDTPGKLGAPLGPYGERSPFEKAVRWRRDSKTPETGSSFSPLKIRSAQSHLRRFITNVITLAFQPSIRRSIGWSSTAWWIDRCRCRWRRFDDFPP